MKNKTPPKRVKLAKSSYKKIIVKKDNRNPSVIQADHKKWRISMKTDTVQGYTSYMENFPNGIYNSIANTRIKRIQKNNKFGAIGNFIGFYK